MEQAYISAIVQLRLARAKRNRDAARAALAKARDMRALIDLGYM